MYSICNSSQCIRVFFGLFFMVQCGLVEWCRMCIVKSYSLARKLSIWQRSMTDHNVKDINIKPETVCCKMSFVGKKCVKHHTFEDIYMKPETVCCKMSLAVNFVICELWRPMSSPSMNISHDRKDWRNCECFLEDRVMSNL